MALTQADGVVTAAPSAPALADEDSLKPATVVDPSGALLEPTIVKRVDTKHPAVDDNPRAGQPIAANTITFNDPIAPGHVVAEHQLALGAKQADPAASTAEKTEAKA